MFLFRERLLAITSKYEVQAADGTPILYVERPTYLLRSVFAYFLGTIAAMLTLVWITTLVRSVGQDLGALIVLAGLALAPAVFVKGGAEGMHCAALPGLGLGLALKVDDGAKRGAERALAEVLAALLPEARAGLADQLDGEILNWRGVSVGRIVAGAALRRALAALEATPRRQAQEAAR